MGVSNRDSKLIWESYTNNIDWDKEIYIINLVIDLRTHIPLGDVDDLEEFKQRMDSGEMDWIEFDELKGILDDQRIAYDQYEKGYMDDSHHLLLAVQTHEEALQAVGMFRGQFNNEGDMRTKLETGEPETPEELENHSDGPHRYLTEDGRRVSISIYSEAPDGGESYTDDEGKDWFEA